MTDNVVPFPKKSTDTIRTEYIEQINTVGTMISSTKDTLARLQSDQDKLLLAWFAFEQSIEKAEYRYAHRKARTPGDVLTQARERFELTRAQKINKLAKGVPALASILDTLIYGKDKS